ncbi:MAG: UDP-N-acetylmuramoyl-tripeptide--D-alanyl-D-alanine ligase [Phycisphaerae bacterium]|nr:UDP-N-acetylmuramoyl-tripeptide--D-alanyl-D-alanine ligase [Phycisphaerae bacterium]
MRALTGNELRQAIRGRWLSRSEPIPIRGVSIDSRTARRDDVFVAVRGETFDGHDYLPAAAAAGCVAAVVDLQHPPSPAVMQHFPAGVVGAPDTRQALLDLGGYYRSVIPATVVGVTGSNGKTTVKRMIHHILQTRLTGTCSPKSFNNEIGVPLTLLSAGAGDDYVICEVGASAPGEISRLARAVKPNIPVITGIAPCHLEKMGCIEQIAVEKSALLGWMGPRDVAVVSADSPPLEHALRSYERRLIRFGVSPDAHLRLTGYEWDGKKQRFQINDRDWGEMPIPGRHNAINALAAVAVAARFGFCQEDALAALADFPGVEMRLQCVEAGALRVMNDAYNANPASMLAAAEVLASTPGKRRVMILGDMLELGEQSDHQHAEVGRKMAGMDIGCIIAVGERARRLAEAAEQAGAITRAFATRDEILPTLADLLAPGDVVLLKGSRATKMESLLPEIEKIGRNGATLSSAPKTARKTTRKTAAKSKTRTRKKKQ